LKDGIRNHKPVSDVVGLPGYTNILHDRRVGITVDANTEPKMEILSHATMQFSGVVVKPKTCFASFPELFEEACH